jgi:hypothetical protein
VEFEGSCGKTRRKLLNQLSDTRMVCGPVDEERRSANLAQFYYTEVTAIVAVSAVVAHNIDRSFRNLLGSKIVP